MILRLTDKQITFRNISLSNLARLNLTALKQLKFNLFKAPELEYWTLKFIIF